MVASETFAPALLAKAAGLLDKLKARGLVVATAESCTGGLIAGLLTAIPGSSDVFDRGFVTYSNTAKAEALGVPAQLIVQHGAVSAEVAAAMAIGALHAAGVDLAVAVTGVAGPGGGTAEKPVGLVFLGASRRDGKTLVTRANFTDLDRNGIRIATVEEALALLDAIAG